ncbi:MAG TPA: hypothetical protein VMT16_16770 [Thermoanaerobaculia bacterium]|nr:hypothetical protein [Thermoanaerobaculia bacterium]
MQEPPGLEPAPSAIPQPFGSEPRPLTPSGCSRNSVIGCGVLVVLLGVAAVLLLARSNEVMVWVLEKLETRVEEKLPEDLPAADRARLAAAFQRLYRAIESGEVDPAALQRLQRELLDLAQADRRLTVEEVRDLTVSLEAAAGEQQPLAATAAAG